MSYPRRQEIEPKWWMYLLVAACFLVWPAAAYLVPPTVEATTLQTDSSIRNGQVEYRAGSRACDDPLPSAFGQWLAPNNVYRINLNKPPFSSREQQVSQKEQIAELVARIGNCYNIKSTAATTSSMMVDAPIGENTQVWNDSLILTVERRR